jgi:hypothetical protein
MDEVVDKTGIFYDVIGRQPKIAQLRWVLSV